MHGLNGRCLLVIMADGVLHSCIAYDDLTACFNDAVRIAAENPTWVVARHDMNGYITIHWHNRQKGV